MRHLVALLSGCLLCGSSVSAADTSCRNNWVEIHHTAPGIVLTTGIEDLRVGHAAPGVLEKIGPLLCAAGTEELRVAKVASRSGYGDPARRAERAIRFVEYIHGREVRQSTVSISLNVETHQVMRVNAKFLPDRDVARLPRLTAAEARAKVEAAMRKDGHVEVATSGERVQIALYETPAPYLAYEIEQTGFAPARGVLVWVFSAKDVEAQSSYEVSVDAATGNVISLQEMIAGHRES